MADRKEDSLRQLQHDFSNTAQNIRNTLMLIMEGKIPGITVDKCGVGVLDNLSKQVRNLKRIQKSMLSINLDSIDNNCFTIDLKHVLQDYQSSNTDEIIISVDYPNTIIYIDFNLLDFKRILDNLINNAKDILRSEKINNPNISIRVSLYMDIVKIEIIDNGPGVKDIDKVLKKGFTTKGGEHKGMGLSIVQELLEKNGSRLNLSSDGFSGANFWFELTLNDKMRG